MSTWSAPEVVSPNSPPNAPEIAEVTTPGTPIEILAFELGSRCLGKSFTARYSTWTYEMAAISTAGKAVAILGAGTQGRRLAYMVSNWFTRNPRSNPIRITCYFHMILYPLYMASSCYFSCQLKTQCNVACIYPPFSCSYISPLQWSSQGGTVNLLDLQQKQLQDSVPYIDGLRAASPLGTSHKWGTVRPLPANDLKSAFSDAWLILEVSPPNHREWVID